MLYAPSRGYRVCLHCGKIMKSNQLKHFIYEGKNVRVCPFCKEPENKDVNGTIISISQAVDLFAIVQMKGQEFMMTPEIEAKYERLYDNCLIPKEIRV